MLMNTLYQGKYFYYLYALDILTKDKGESINLINRVSNETVHNNTATGRTPTVG